MAETLGVVYARRAHTPRPISDCCIFQNYSNPKSVVRISIAETPYVVRALRAHTTRPI